MAAVALNLPLTIRRPHGQKDIKTYSPMGRDLGIANAHDSRCWRNKVAR